MPRIIMAIFLGLVISTPLELKIFEDSIKMRIEEEKKNILEQRLEYLTGDLQKVEDEIVAIQQGVGDTYSDDIHTGNKMIDDLSDSINQTQPKLNAVQNQLRSLSSEKMKLDRKANNYEQRKNAIEAKARPLYAKRAALSSKLKRWRSERSGMQTTVGTMTTTQSDDKRQSLLKLNAERDSIKHLIANSREYNKDYTPNDVRLKGSIFDKINLEYSGFNSELKAFHDIRKEDASTNVAAWFIMLLFVIIETAPTFFKMMMEDGPYDDLLRAEKHRVRVLSQKRISDVNDEVCNGLRF
jgi:chromosome segregation ATPase